MTKRIEIIRDDSAGVEVRLPSLGYQWSFVKEDWEALREYFFAEAFKGAKLEMTPNRSKDNVLYALGYLQGCFDEHGYDGNMVNYFQTIKEYIVLND